MEDKKIKKVLYIDSTYLGHKPNRERCVIIMSVWIKSYSVDITIVTTNEAKKFYSELFDPEVFKRIRFIRLPLSRDFNPSGAASVVFEYLKRVVGILLLIVRLKKKRYRYDNIYALTAIFPDVVISYILKKIFHGSKMYVVFDNFVKKPSEREGNYFYNLIPYLSYRISLYFMKRADVLFVAMVKSNLDKVFKMFDQTKARIVPDMNGVNLEYINKVKPLKETYDILYIGRLHKDKGIIDLLEILGRVKKTLPNVKAFIAGPVEHDMKEIIEEKINSLELKHNIEMVSYVGGPHKYEVLKSSKTFCFFSYYESYPIAVLEAMASRLKIFAYNLDVLGQKPFNMGDIETFNKGGYDVISERIIDYVQEWPHEKKEMDLSLLDQSNGAKLHYANLI